HSGAPSGVYMSSYMGIFLLIRALANYFVFNSQNAMIALTLLMAVVWRALVLLILALIEVGDRQVEHTLALLILGSGVQAIFGYWAYQWFEKYDNATYKDPRARQREEQEMILDEENL